MSAAPRYDGRRLWLFAVLIPFLLACGGSHAPRSEESVKQQSGREPALSEPDPGREFARATALKGALRGLQGTAREAARRRAVEAYRAIRSRPEASDDLRAKAAFRAAELLRAGGRCAEARREFTLCSGLSRSSSFQARALLELAHLERRAGRGIQALRAYREIAGDALLEPRFRDRAALWAGRLQAAQGREEEARRVWLRVAGQAEDPLDRVRAFDLLAANYVLGGDLEAAAGTLEQARSALAEFAGEQTELGERVRRALSRMRSVAALKRAIADRVAAGR